MDDDTTISTDASLSECDHDRFERNHYFHGKLMTARDMQAEQAYHAGQRRAHARSVSGSGVAWGLEPSIRDDGDSLVVTVTKGYALDACGRPIVVPQEREKTITDETLVTADRLSVWLSYEACLKESVPVDGAETACEDECAYNRVLEVYDIEVVEPTTEPSVEKAVEAVTFPGWDDFETVSESDRSQPAPDDHGLATIAETYREATGDEAGVGTADSQLFLGTFTPGSNGTWNEVEDLPTSYVYTNDMLYAATARHAADFRNPHEVTLTTAPLEDMNAATFGIQDDESGSPLVTVASDDGSVDVVHESPQTIDLSIESRIAAMLSDTIPGMIDDVASRIVEERVEPLENYAVEMALKHKGLIFQSAANRFETPTAMRVSMLARAAVDDRLERESDAEAADNRRVRIVWDDDSIIETFDEDVYRDLLEYLYEDERTVADEVEDQVTEASHERLEMALDRLEAAIDDDEAGTLRLAAAQDDLCDAVEWLEPVEEEPEEPDVETTRVPDVEGQPEADAVDELADNRLSADISTREVNTAKQIETWGYGRVMAQSPTAGTTVEVDSTVKLLVLVSRELTVLDNIAGGRAEELGTVGIDWVHELAEADIPTVVRGTSFSTSQVEGWVEQARAYLKALYFSLRQGVEFDRSLAVADAYGDVSHDRFLELSDAAIQSMLEDAVDENLITAEDGRIVLEESNYLHFQPDRFESDWDLTNHDSITLGGDRYYP